MNGLALLLMIRPPMRPRPSPNPSPAFACYHQLAAELATKSDAASQFSSVEASLPNAFAASVANHDAEPRGCVFEFVLDVDNAHLHYFKKRRKDERGGP